MPSNNAFEKKTDFLESLEETSLASQDDNDCDDKQQTLTAQQAIARLGQKTMEVATFMGLMKIVVSIMLKNSLLIFLSGSVLLCSDMMIYTVLDSAFLAKKTSLVIGISMMAAFIQGIISAFVGLLLTRSILMNKIEKEETPLFQGYSIFLSFTILLSFVSFILGTAVLTFTETIEQVFIKDLLFYTMIGITLCPISFIIAQYGLILVGACSKRKTSIDIALEQATPFLKLLFKGILFFKSIPIIVAFVLSVFPVHNIIFSAVVSGSLIVCMMGMYIILSTSYRMAGYLHDNRYHIMG